MYRLYTKEKFFKLLDNYYILNEHQEPVYQVRQKFKFFLREVEVFNLSQQLVLAFKENFSFFLKNYSLVAPSQFSLNITQQFTFFKPVFQVQIPDGLIEIRGDFFAHNYEILLNGRVIGGVHKEYIAFTDTYVLDIHEAKYELLIVGCMLCMDEYMDDRARQSSN